MQHKTKEYVSPRAEYFFWGMQYGILSGSATFGLDNLNEDESDNDFFTF